MQRLVAVQTPVAKRVVAAMIVLKIAKLLAATMDAAVIIATIIVAKWKMKNGLFSSKTEA
jgi:hypothetical protein